MRIPMPDGQSVAAVAGPIAPPINPQAAAEPYTRAAVGFERLARTEAVIARVQEQHAAVLEATKAMGQARVDGTQMLMDQQNAAPAGAPEFTKNFQDAWSAHTAGMLDKASDAAKPFLEQRLALLGSELTDHALAFEAHQTMAKRQSDLNDTVDLHANAVRTDPTQFESALGEVSGAVAGAGLPAANADAAQKQVHGVMATALVEGWNDRDPHKAIDLLNGGTLDGYLSPPQKNQLLDRSQTRADKLDHETQAVLKADVASKLADERAAIRDRGYGLGQLTPGLIAKAYPDQAASIADTLDTERQFYNARQSVALTSPDEDQALLDHWKPEGAGYADQVKRRDILEKAINAKRPFLDIESNKFDPASYVQGTSPALADVTKQAATDPSKLPAALALSDELQTRLGLPSDQHRVLSNSQAQTMAQSIAASPETAPQKFRDLQAQYGAYWPQAWRDLTGVKGGLPIAYQAVGTLDDQREAALLARALGERGKSGKAITNLLPPGANTGPAGIDQSVEAAPAVRQLLGSLSQSGASAGQQDGILSAVKTLAYAHVVYDGAPAASATAMAVKAFTDKYEFMPNGGARVPHELMPQVSANAAATLSGLSVSSVDPNSPLSQMHRDYPWTRGIDANVIDSTQGGDTSGGGRKLEFYAANERDNPSPGKPTVEIFDKDMGSSDVMGELLSHHLPSVDPKVADFRSQIISSMTTAQKDDIRGDYENDKKSGLVDRGDSFEQWLTKQGGDSFFRGYQTGQWSPNEYTGEQKAIYAKLQAYLDASTPKLGSEIAVPSTFGAGPTAPKPDEYLSLLKASPTWITSPKADALWLMDPAGRLVRDSGGAPVAVPFAAPAPPADPVALPLRNAL